jgi:hypothetical protein
MKIEIRENKPSISFQAVIRRTMTMMMLLQCGCCCWARCDGSCVYILPNATMDSRTVVEADPKRHRTQYAFPRVFPTSLIRLTHHDPPVVDVVFVLVQAIAHLADVHHVVVMTMIVMMML